MGYSEIVVMFLVYGGLITFFLVPFPKKVNSRNQQQSQIAYSTVIKDTFIRTIFHKKAIFALILLSFTLFSIWGGYAQAEYHINSHSGYPPISTNQKAITSICSVFVYTIVIYLAIVLVKTQKIVKNAR